MFTALKLAALHSCVSADFQQQHFTQISEDVGLPGNPLAMRITILNSAADSLDLHDQYTHCYKGNFTSAPHPTIPNDASRAINYGVAIAPDATGAINVTFSYGSTEGPYALINVFAKSPLYPNMVGITVNSNSHEDAITTKSSFFGDGPTTEVDYVVMIASPP
jgi:hypothetical protein